MNKTIQYTASPLPFMGQKRAFLKEFQEALNLFNPEATYLDLFGGSGLLSHTIKQKYPNARVIFNDHDNFTKRLEAIEATNCMLDELRAFGSREGLLDEQRLTSKQKADVLSIFKRHEERGIKLDYITISTNILFAPKVEHNLEDIAKKTFYFCVRKSNYAPAKGYLSGVERVSGDFRAIYEAHKNIDNLILVLDPPYLSTTQHGYSKRWFGVVDFLNLLAIAEKHPFIFFSSKRSEFYDIVRFLLKQRQIGGSIVNIKSGAERRTRINTVSEYVDELFYSKGA